MARTRNLTPAAELRECAHARTAEQASCDRVYNARQLAGLAEGLQRGVNAKEQS